MSKFSNYLRALIEQREESITTIARNTGIERTSIHKALKDERVLPYKALQSLARYFGLTLEERQEFFRLHDILLQGEEAYENRQAVCTLINTLAAVDFSMFPPPKVNTLPLTDSLISGEYAVHSLIRSALIYEVSHHRDPKIQMYLPEKLDLTMEFMELWLNQYPFSVDEILCIYHADSISSPDPVRRNLKKLESVIPMCLASHGNYKPYYFTEPFFASALSPLSYYIVAPSCLILLSGDLSTARISGDRELIGYYRDFFQKQLPKCDLLTRCSNDILHVLREYIDGTSPDSLQIFMNQPCPGRYITPEIIQKYLNSDDMPYPAMYSLVEQHFSVLRQISQNYLTIFTEKGLADLVTSCVLQDLPPQYVPPLDPEDIRQMLLSLHEEISDGNISGFIVRPTYLQLPDYLSLYVTPAELHIYTTNAFVFGAYCCNIHIQEPSLCRIFTEFIRTLPGSHLVYSQEETMNLLEQYIAQLP